MVDTSKEYVTIVVASDKIIMHVTTCFLLRLAASLRNYISRVSFELQLQNVFNSMSDTDKISVKADAETFRKQFTETQEPMEFFRNYLFSHFCNEHERVIQSTIVMVSDVLSMDQIYEMYIFSRVSGDAYTGLHYNLVCEPKCNKTLKPN